MQKDSQHFPYKMKLRHFSKLKETLRLPPQPIRLSDAQGRSYQYEVHLDKKKVKGNKFLNLIHPTNIDEDCDSSFETIQCGIKKGQ